MSGFEIVSPNTVRIGKAELQAHTHDPPLRGMWRYTVDAAGHDNFKPWPKLSPYQLDEVRPADLPNGISISIYQPRSTMRDLGYMVIAKLDDLSTITVTVNFNYQDWHLPMTLPSFLEEYRQALRASGTVADVTVCPTEIGLDIECKMPVSATENYHVAYDRTCEHVLSSYRSALASAFGNKRKPKPNDPGTDTHGPRWWVRYVLVPALGTLGAIAVGVLALLK